MKTQSATLKDHDGINLYVYKWLPDEGSPKAVVQLAHGMQEHAGRYGHVAEALTKAGYAVYAPDQRGHGRSIKNPDGHGDLGPGGWESAVLNLKEVTDMIRKEQPSTPIFLLGHSYGSFLTQAYLQRWGAGLKGAILSGTNGRNPLVKVGLPVAKAVSLIRGKGRKAGLLEKLSMGNFNDAFEPGETGFEWLSRDKNEVRKFVDDPMCGVPFPNSFFVNMTALLDHVWTGANERKVPSSTPLYFIAGTDDPVGDRTRGIDALIRRYHALGNKHLTHRYYPGGRHEMLNGINKQEVITEMVRWLDEQLERRR